MSAAGFRCAADLIATLTLQYRELKPATHEGRSNIAYVRLMQAPYLCNELRVLVLAALRVLEVPQEVVHLGAQHLGVDGGAPDDGGGAGGSGGSVTRLNLREGLIQEDGLGCENEVMCPGEQGGVLVGSSA